MTIMKKNNTLVQFLSFTFIFLLTASCQKNNENYSSDLTGEWFRKIPNSVWAGQGQPIVERGETHFILAFKDDGSFFYETITLGIYEGTTLSDTSAWSKNTGTFEVSGSQLNIQLESRIWWDAFYEDMDTPDTLDISHAQIYKDATYSVDLDSLTFEYQNLTVEGFEEHLEYFKKQD